MHAALSTLSACVIATAVLTTPATAQVFEEDTQTVTVQVAPITVLALQGGTVMLTISDAHVVAGVDAMTVQDQSTRLLWGTNSSGRKITAQTSLANPLFELRVVAVNPTRGTPAAEMLLGTVPQDLLLNIGRTLGNCTLQYTGTALASRGRGTDVHTITFTVTSQ